VRRDQNPGFLFDSEDLAEEVEIDLDLRKDILFFAGSMAGWTHWEVLGLPWNAPADRVREAYLDRAKIFHPDRFTGRQLGSYRQRLARIFQRLTEARDALSSEVARAEYARTTAPPEEVARVAARQIENDDRARERRARIARSHPLVARMVRARELADRGRRALAEERFEDAARDLHTASALDAGVGDIRPLADQASRKAVAARAREIWEKARAAELQNDLDRAQLLAEQAAGIDPGDPRHGIYVAQLALGRGALETARSRAEEAVRAAPTLAAAHEVLGEVLAAQGDTAAARKALTRALEIAPSLPRAREQLRKLPWSFLR